MISIIIPAHNEEAVIARGLRAILTGAEAGELEVIVACNGCTDRTAAIARGFGPPVQVLEIPAPSKIAALNEADAVAAGFPRFYVDADVVLDLASVRRVAAVLDSGAVRFATPTLHINLSQTTWPVRAFYRVWTALPYNREAGQVGTGVYALSRTGRERFQRFPEVLNDDGFVRFLFTPRERATVPPALSRVNPPRSLAALLRAKSRVRAGQAQLRRLYPDRPASDRHAAEPTWRWLLRHPGLWWALPVYCTVNLWSRHRAARTRDLRTPDWSRDDSRSWARG
ncbi:MAG: glycosyltransferase family 2 protein [Planctomycetota bacterium]